MTTIYFDKPIDTLTIVRDYRYPTADFVFDDYKVNLDLWSACCEAYYIYFNGKTLPFYRKQNRYEIKIEPSTSVSFEFTEKTYREHKAWHYQKNSMTMKFSGGDRVRANREKQWVGDRSCIYTRCIYLERDGSSKLLGMV